MSRASSGKSRGTRPSKASKASKPKSDNETTAYYTREKTDTGSHTMVDFSDQPGYVQLNGKWYHRGNLPPSVLEQLEQYDQEQQKNHRFITVNGKYKVDSDANT
jgi:hypothetical protein